MARKKGAAAFLVPYKKRGRLDFVVCDETGAVANQKFVDKFTNVRPEYWSFYVSQYMLATEKIDLMYAQLVARYNNSLCIFLVRSSLLNICLGNLGINPHDIPTPDTAKFKDFQFMSALMPEWAARMKVELPKRQLRFPDYLEDI